MAHWAQLNDNNEVVQVTVGDNNDPNGDEGYQWLVDNLGGTWMKTSYNTIGGIHREGGTPFRKNYGSIGFVYDENRDAFIPPKPFESWILNEETCQWEIPVPMPTEGGPWMWVEKDLNWQAFTSEE
jgi:hypothetical protein